MARVGVTIMESHMRGVTTPASRWASGGDDLPLGWKPVSDFFRQLPGLPKLGDVLILDRGGHPLALPSRSGHG